MSSTVNHPGLVLSVGLAAVLAAALAPAGLGGEPIPTWSWITWAVVASCGVGRWRATHVPLTEGMRRVAWLLPAVLVLAIPAGLLSPSTNRWWVVLALSTRALAAATSAVALALSLGPSGLVHGARALRVPARLVDVLGATLASLSVVLRQIRAMLRAREARRPGFGAWSDLASAPGETLGGFGRLTAALLLRSLERAESLERARRARGLGE